LNIPQRLGEIYSGGAPISQVDLNTLNQKLKINN